jgi:hypothetical protein
MAVGRLFAAVSPQNGRTAGFPEVGVLACWPTVLEVIYQSPAPLSNFVFKRNGSTDPSLVAAEGTIGSKLRMDYQMRLFQSFSWQQILMCWQNVIIVEIIREKTSHRIANEIGQQLNDNTPPDPDIPSYCYFGATKQTRRRQQPSNSFSLSFTLYPATTIKFCGLTLPAGGRSRRLPRNLTNRLVWPPITSPTGVTT